MADRAIKGMPGAADGKARSGAAAASRAWDRPPVKARPAATVTYPPLAGAEAPLWELVQRVAASRRLSRSALLANFLLFVAHRSLTGRDADISEQQIGIHVFGRDGQFNRSDDNIVRTYARMLRRRLEEYFRNEGVEEPFTIAIPRGGYVPVFTKRESAAAESAQDRVLPEELAVFVESSLAAAGRSPFVPPLFSGLAVCALLFAAILAAVVVLTHSTPADWLHAQTPGRRLSQRLWSHIFEANRDTYIVPADGGLVMLQSFLPKHVNLTDYASGNYRTPDTIRQGLHALATSQPTMLSVPPTETGISMFVHKVEVLGARRYTSVADLELTSQLSRLPEVVTPRLLIRYARDLRVDDLRRSNLVLLGSPDSNPWAEIFQQLLNFYFTYGAGYGGSPVIANRRPLAGERATYGSEDSDTAHSSYGVIAYLPNLGMTGGAGSSNGETSGHVILVEGVNMAGTQAAGAFLLSSEQMRPVLERAIGPDGELCPFEVLIQTGNVAANAVRTRVLSERVNLN